MDRIEIFRPGKHTAMSGVALQFAESDLQAAAGAYDPKLHEAPIVVGHPKEDAPAYGWIKGLSFAEGGLQAELVQVDPAFAELVREGRFKKVSASFYTPDAKANPVPGSYYLRHVGFLGAQPPAVKGLKQVAFAEAEGTVEFADWGHSETSSLFRGLRDWFISQFGLEKADQVLPDYRIRSIEEASRAPDPVHTSLGYVEPTPTKEPPTMSAEDLAAREAKLKTDQDALAAQQAQFAERDAALKRAETARRAEAHASFAEGLVKSGKLLPKDKPAVLAFMAPLAAADGVLEFGEGDAKKSVPLLKAFEDFLAAQPARVDFTERAADKGEHTEGLSDAQVAARARAYKDRQAEAGMNVSYAEAVDAVHAGTDKA